MKETRSSSGDGPIVSLQDVSVVFGDAVPVVALDRVTLTIEPGEFVTVVGTSGSGKSTLLSVMGALRRPTAGVVAIAACAEPSDRDMTMLRRRSIGYVFQDFQLLRHLTALDNVLLGSRYLNQSRDARERAARELLDALGVGQRADHHPPQLSGGERQRVAIARALVRDPVLILADEPTGNLDKATGEVVLSALIEQRSSRTALVIVTHDEDIAATSQRTIRLSDGAIVPSTDS